MCFIPAHPHRHRPQQLRENTVYLTKQNRESRRELRDIEIKIKRGTEIEMEREREMQRDIDAER